MEWTDSDKTPEEAIDRDRLLTLVSTYWFTATAGTSATLYYEDAAELKKMSAGLRPAPVQVPVGVAVFPADIFLPLRRLADRDLPNIVHWSEYDRGGHFAAMEEPDLFVADLRAFSRKLA
jgi:pimeloyl-ACP methyl ester carboxylesterase